MESTEATSIYISWRPPTLSSLHTSYYLINVNNLNNTDIDMKQVNTTNGLTFLNVTGLLPGTTYELTVVAVSEDLDRETVVMSQPSNSIMATTEFTGNSVNFNSSLVT